jgi:hypothetical protein
MGVAGHQRVEGPGDLGDAAGHRPGPLVQLEREADAAPGRGRHDAGDVAVQRVLGRGVEEPDAGPDQALVSEGAGHVVAGLGERAQQLDGHRRVRRAPPDAGEQLDHAVQVVEVGQLAHGHPRRAGRHQLGGLVDDPVDAGHEPVLGVARTPKCR